MIKNIFVAAAFGVAALGAQAAPNLIVNGAMDGTTTGYVYNASPASVAALGIGVPIEAGTVGGWDGSFVSITSNSGPWGNPSGLAGFDAATFGGYVAGVQSDGVLAQALTLTAGTYTLSWSDANRGANQTYSVLFNGADVGTYHTFAGAGWGTESVTFTTAGGVGLAFVGGTTFDKTDATSFIDNVSLTAVPEPTTLMMMAVATLGLLAWRRRTQA